MTRKHVENDASQRDDMRHELTSQQSDAVLSIASGLTITEAALKIGVHRSTVSRWMSRDPWFRRELSEVRCELHRAAIDSMRGLVRDAVDVLKNELRGGDHAWQVALAIVRPALPSLAVAPETVPEGEAVVKDLACAVRDDRLGIDLASQLDPFRRVSEPTPEDLEKAYARLTR
jgi:hypothetical protein